MPAAPVLLPERQWQEQSQLLVQAALWTTKGWWLWWLLPRLAQELQSRQR